MKTRLGTMRIERGRAFTLIELIVVIGIIAVMVALVAPAFTSINRGAQISNAAQMMIDQLNRARQEALTNDRIVEVRFYNTASQQNPSDLAYRAMRYFVLTSTGTNSVGTESVQYFPPGVIISTGTAFSTLISGTLPANLPYSVSGTTQQETLASHSSSSGTAAANFVCFHFRPNGTTDLNSGTNADGSSINWFWTLRSQYDVPLDSQDATVSPANFATIQLDPVTGIVHLYRP